MIDLETTRREIDQIDSQIVKLFEQRMQLVQDVAEYKLKTGKQVLDVAREREKLKKLTAMAHGEFNAHGVEELFVQIMSISRKWQYRLLQEHEAAQGLSQCYRNYAVTEQIRREGARVVYCGIEGSYAYQAMTGYFGQAVKKISVRSFRQAMEAIRDGAADYAVLPVENTSAGIVTEVYDLMGEFDHYIVDTCDLEIRHALLGVPGARISDIKEVTSHPQALQQCSRYLDEHPDWIRIKSENTAVSARKVAREGNPARAAIASVGAAALYGLVVLDDRIVHNAVNTTRFIIVSGEPVFRADANRICITFSFRHESGALYNMLSHVVYNNLNMTNIESRPLVGQNWQYRFYIEFEGNLADPGVKNALKGIETEAFEMKFLGNY